MEETFFSLSQIPVRPHHHSFLDTTQENFASAATDEMASSSDEGSEWDCDLLVGDADFKPIEHPLEPPDDDLPVNYPITDAFLFDLKDGHACKESPADRRKRAEVHIETEENKEEEEELRAAPAARKKRHAVNKEQSNIFQIFNQCKLEYPSAHRSSSSRVQQVGAPQGLFQHCTRNM